MEHLGLLYFSASAGFIIVLGSLLLIWKGRILIDTEGQSVSEVELPFGFRVKTQMPFVIMFLFGAFLLALPLFMIRNQLDQVPTLLVTGKLPSRERLAGRGVKVYATVDHCDVSNEVRLNIPYQKNPKYRIMVYDNKGFVFDEYIKWEQVVDSTYTLQEFIETNFDKTGGDTASSTQVVTPAEIIKEPTSVVSAFK